jgi:dsDNA-specific endonuclease/ATPase MutS2
LGAFVEPKLGSWDLSRLVVDPARDEFNEFLKVSEKKAEEFEKIKDTLSNNIASHAFENIFTSHRRDHTESWYRYRLSSLKVRG